MNDLHLLYKLLAYSQERSREYWGNRWSGTGSIQHIAIQKFAKGKKGWSFNKLTSIWGFLLVPLKKRLLAKIFSRWYLSVALAFPYWKEEKRRKEEKVENELIKKELKHCQRHNGPEGWVHITRSQFTVYKSWTYYNFRISIKHQLQNLSQHQHLDEI